MADTIDGGPSVQIFCDCGAAVDIVPAIGDRFRRHIICHQVIISLDNPYFSLIIYSQSIQVHMYALM